MWSLYLDTRRSLSRFAGLQPMVDFDLIGSLDETVQEVKRNGI